MWRIHKENNSINKFSLTDHIIVAENTFAVLGTYVENTQ